MGFYIIAASVKENGQPKSATQVLEKISGLRNFNNEWRKQVTAPAAAGLLAGTTVTATIKDPKAHVVTEIKVDKTNFKIGSLDQLMVLNEQSAKLDMQIDIAVKKYEKICFDTGSTKLDVELDFGLGNQDSKSAYL